MTESENPYQTPGSEIADTQKSKPPTTSGTALASGIIALVALLLPAIGIRVGFLWWGVIVALCAGLGVHGLIQIIRNPNELKGRGWAIWGIVYSVFIIIVVILSMAEVI